MKWCLLSPMALGLALAACSCPTGPAPTTSDSAASRAPSAPAWVAKVKAGAPLIDVRSQGEWDSGHVEGAKLIPHDQIEARIPEIEAMLGGDKSKPVVVYCRSGNRSARAKSMLERAGFTNVENAGGYDAVRAQLAAGK